MLGSGSRSKDPRVELDRCELRCVRNIAIGSGPPVGEAATKPWSDMPVCRPVLG